MLDGLVIVLNGHDKALSRQSALVVQGSSKSPRTHAPQHTMNDKARISRARLLFPSSHACTHRNTQRMTTRHHHTLGQQEMAHILFNFHVANTRLLLLQHVYAFKA
jgi:hypothetical protein